MNRKLNHALLGVIALAVAGMALFGRFAPFHTGGLIMAAGGLALIALYKTKGKIWSLVLGAYLFYMGASQVLWQFLRFDVGRLVGAAFFLIPGVICAALYAKRRKRATLCAASFLLWFSAFLVIEKAGVMWLHGGALFFLFMCAACFTVTLLDGRRGGLFALGWVLLGLAALSAGFWRLIIIIPLIIFGVTMLSRRNTSGRGLHTDDDGHIIGEWREKESDDE